MKNEFDEEVPETEVYEEVHAVPAKRRLRLSLIGKF
jgi:hypothetical protein